MSAKEPSPADSKFITVINLPLPLQERAARISVYHQSFEKAAQDQLGYAFLCGVELTQAKDECAHGQFMKWRETALPQIPQGTAGRYMQFAHAIQSQSKQIANLTAKPLQLTNGELPEEDRKIILKAVHDFADGATLTELYRDLNILRKPKAKQYHPPKLTADQQAAAEEAAAAELLKTLIGDLNLVDVATLGKINRDNAHLIREARELMIEKGKLFQQFLKPTRNKKARK